MILSALALALLLQASSQQPTTAASTPASTANSVAATPVFGPTHVEDEALHLAFDLPEGIQSRKDLADDANAKFVKKSPSGDPCARIVTLAFDPKIIRRITFYHFDGACYPDGVTQEVLRNVSRASLTSILHFSGKESMTSPLDFKLDGHIASVMTGNVYSQANKGVLYGEMACVEVEKDIACWAFVSSTASKVARLATLPVQFGARTSVPIIPEDVSSLMPLPTLTFHDDKRHIELNYPGTFANNQPRATDILAKQKEALPDKQKPILDCVNIMLSTTELGENANSSIIIFDLNTPCQHLKLEPRTLRSVATGMVKGMSKVAPAKMGQPIPYTLDTHDAVFIQGNLSPPNKPEVSILEACFIASEDIVCIQISSTSADRIHTIAASTISFDRHLGVPLVPVNLLTTGPAEP